MSSSLRLHGLYSPRNSPGQNTGMGSPSPLQGVFPNPGIEPRSPALQVDSLPAEPQGKPQMYMHVYAFSTLVSVKVLRKNGNYLASSRKKIYYRTHQGIICGTLELGLEAPPGPKAETSPVWVDH